MNFRTVSHGFDLKFLEKVYMAVDRIRNVDISEICLRMDNNKFGGGYFSDDRNELVFSSSAMDMMNDADQTFLAVHEVRHIWQAQTRKLVQKHGCFEWTPTGYKISGQEMMRLTYTNQIEYWQFPWEADANGFAWSILDQYTPENELLRESIQYAKIPEDFKIKVRTKKKLNGFQLSDNLLHRPNKTGNKR